MEGVGLHDYKHPKYGETILNRVNEVIERGRTSVAAGVDQMVQEFTGREDLIVRPTALDFDIDERGIRPLVISKDCRFFNLTPHAEGQLLERAGIPERFAERLADLKDFNLLKHNLKELLPQVSPEGLMLRNVGGTLKGVMSTAYRRMDSSPIFEAFIRACVAKGLVPYRAHVTDTRNVITFVYPELFTTGDNPDGKPEVIMLGLQIISSDYGKGALMVQLVVFRVWCANLAMGDNVLRKVHLGRRFDGFGANDVVALSNKTIALDTATIASAMRDVVGQGQKYVRALAERIGEASKQEVDITKAIESLKKKGLKKDTLDKVKTTFESEMPVEVLPQGNTAWRLSNALSFLAKSAQGDEQLDLQSAAYAVIDPKAA